MTTYPTSSRRALDRSASPILTYVVVSKRRASLRAAARDARRRGDHVAAQNLTGEALALSMALARIQT